MIVFFTGVFLSRMFLGTLVERLALFVPTRHEEDDCGCRFLRTPHNVHPCEWRTEFHLPTVSNTDTLIATAPSVTVPTTTRTPGVAKLAVGDVCGAEQGQIDAGPAGTSPAWLHPM
jgi:hypothetical protein